MAKRRAPCIWRTVPAGAKCAHYDALCEEMLEEQRIYRAAKRAEARGGSADGGLVGAGRSGDPTSARMSPHVRAAAAGT
jgi:hypothetical protein